MEALMTSRSASAAEALQTLRTTRAAVHEMGVKMLQETLKLELDNSEACRRQLLARDAEMESLVKLLHERENEVQKLRVQVQEQAQEIVQCQELLESTHVEQATYHRLAAQNKQLFEALRQKESESNSLNEQVRELSTAMTDQQAHFSQKLKTTVYSESVDESKYRDQIRQLSARLQELHSENARLKHGLQHCQVQLAHTTNEFRYATARGVRQKIGGAADTVELQMKLERAENDAVRSRDECENLQQQLARELRRNGQLVDQVQRANNRVIDPKMEICTIPQHNKLRDQLQLAHQALFEETAARRKLRDGSASQKAEIARLTADLKTLSMEVKHAKDARARAEHQAKLLQQNERRHEAKIQALESNRKILREMLDIGSVRKSRPQTAGAESKRRPKSAVSRRPTSEKRSRSHPLSLSKSTHDEAVKVPALSAAQMTSAERSDAVD